MGSEDMIHVLAGLLLVLSKLILRSQIVTNGPEPLLQSKTNGDEM